MYKYICKKCNKAFETRKKYQRYCSRSCANSVNTARRKVEDKSIFKNGINEISSYILGIILSDGCLSYDEHSKRYRITISMNDYEIIEFLRERFSPTKKLYSYKHPNGKDITYTFITTNDYDLKYIKSIGIPERKSTIVNIPLIDRKFERHMIRGIFDGDGSVYVNKTKTKYNDIKREYKYINVSFTSGSYEFAVEINEILHRNNINSHIVKDSRQNHLCWYVKIYSKEDVVRFYLYVYLDCTLYLKRKYNIFNMMI